MSFKEWLKINEVGLGTNSIAVFAQPMMPLVRRGDNPKCDKGDLNCVMSGEMRTKRYPAKRKD